MKNISCPLPWKGGRERERGREGGRGEGRERERDREDVHKIHREETNIKSGRAVRERERGREEERAPGSRTNIPYVAVATLLTNR